MLRKSSHKFHDEYSSGNVSGISLRTFSEEVSVPTTVSRVPEPSQESSRIMPSSKSRGHSANYNSCSSSNSRNPQSSNSRNPQSSNSRNPQSSNSRNPQSSNSRNPQSSNSRNPQVTFNGLNDNNNNNGEPPTILVTDSDLSKPTKCAITMREVNLSYKESILSSLKGTSQLKSVPILNGLNLTVPVGSIYGLLGPSGCGKTSLLRCIMGCQRPESGSIKVFGYDPKTPESGVPGPGVGFMPQEVSLHNDLTILEMISYFGRLFFIPRNQLEDEIDTIMTVLQLPPRNRLIGTLSGGQKRRVSFACALLHKPRLLILDEPTVGVDPLLRERIWDYLIKLSRSDSKTTVVITTHYIEETKRADVVGFMRKGEILAEDNPVTLIQRFQASGLEDVFYKLCTDQKRESLFVSLESSLRGSNQLSIFGSQKIKNQSHCDGISEEENEVSKLPYKFNKSVQGSKLVRWCKQFHALSAKYYTQIFRQPESLVGQFVLPMICLIMFCVCIGGTPSQLPVAVINEENPPHLSELLIKSINSYILHRINYTDMEKALEDVRRGKIWGVLHIRKNFSDAIIQRIFFEQDVENSTIDAGQVYLYADLTNKVLGITLDTVLTHTFQDFVHSALKELDYNPALGLYPVILAEPVFGEFSASDFFGVRDFGAPGMLIVVTYSVSYALTALSLLVERIDDMFERNYSTGCTTTQIILAILTTRFTCNIVGTTTLLTMAVYLFDVPCRGSFFQVLLMLLLQSLCGMSLGMAVSAVVPDFFICTAVSNGILIFIFIISGVLWSLETLPYYIRWFSMISPTTLPAEGMRSMLTRGLSMTHPTVWPGFIITIMWIFIFFFSGVKLFKFQK